jgi:sugar-specific transcriptional regulator TrmB
MNTKVLEEAGFTQGEIRVYISLLELGETTTGDIIRKSKITGSKVYEILDKLKEKGLISYIIKEKTKYFQASSPKRLLDYINKKQEDITKQKKDIENLIPSLESIKQSKEPNQTSQIFEGYEGIKTVFNLILETLQKNEEYYAFSLGEELSNKNLILFLQNYHTKRISNGIKVKIIANSSEKQLFKQLSKLKDLQIRYHTNPVPVGVFIFKGYVASFTFRENPTCFLIKSEQIFNSYKQFFEGLWTISKNNKN